MITPRSASLFLAIWLGACPLAAAADLDFNRDVQPVLAENCFACHGPDANHRKAGLRLDVADAAAAPLESGRRAIVPGDPDASELIARIDHADPDKRMPHHDSGKTLTDAERDLLRRWIADGARYAAHWAFTAPVRPPLPKVSDERWPINAIDRFVLARLDAEGLKPSPQASKRELIRRVTLDLTGLPPTPAEVEAFVADDSPDAYERVVDRLLASEHYGERMAWPWLDAARYADTAGFQGDPYRSQWPWRDWVVAALNDNMPFDRFTVEQIAGDLLPNATEEQRLATAFNRNHMHNAEGGRISEETRVENVFDRAETTATVWLGLTFQCCRCHDHKFDPVTNAEYFKLYDFFNQTSEAGQIVQGDNKPIEPAIAYVPAQQRRRLDELNAKLAEAQRRFDAPDAEADAALAAWVAQWSARIADRWQTLDPVAFTSSGGATLTKRDDLALHVTGERPEKDVYEITARTDRAGITALRLEALVDPQSPGKGPGRDEAGNFVLSELEIAARPLARPDAAPAPVKLATATADYAQQGFPVTAAIDGKVDANNGWAVDGHRFKRSHEAVFYPDAPIGDQGGTELTLRFRFESQHTHHTLALFRVSITSDPAIAKATPPGDAAVIAALSVPADRRSEAQRATLREHFRRTQVPRYAPIAAELDAARTERDAQAKAIAGVQVMVMDTIAKPRDTFVLVQGLYDRRTDQKVTADVPAALPPLPDGVAHDRLALARWIVSPQNPLTARVTVNRYWQTFFGRGIVKTPDDFGLQGSRPTHPDLLDWLAVEFVESGWDVKHLHKLIVNSAVYRQSSRLTPRLAERDPENLLLARSPRFRMPSWMLRDQALATAGLLVPAMGGEPVKPYQPPGIWAEATFGIKRYKQDTGEALYRRSLYTFWRRIVGPTVFFDQAKRQVCEVKADLTNTPLHALVTLNDVTYVEAARALAELAIRSGDTPESRIAFAFARLTARPPPADESSLLASRLAALHERYAADPAARDKLLAVGESKRDPSIDPTDHAAMTALCNLLLNLDETLTRQ